MRRSFLRKDAMSFFHRAARTAKLCWIVEGRSQKSFSYLNGTPAGLAKGEERRAVPEGEDAIYGLGY